MYVYVASFALITILCILTLKKQIKHTTVLQPEIKTTDVIIVKPEHFKVGMCKQFIKKSPWFITPVTEFDITHKTSVEILNTLDVIMLPRPEHKKCWATPVFQKLVELKKNKQPRPTMLYVSGEVFSSPTRPPCNDKDAMIYRSLDDQPRGCPTIHYLQVVQLSTEFNKTKQMMTVQPHKKQSSRSKFCGFITKSVFLRSHYKQADALIRHAMMRLLSEYKKCERPNCRGGWWDTKECFSNYKFAITMENTSEKGYITEKLFNAVMGDSMPIYFGAPDIAKYVNTNRFVHCPIDDAILTEFRSHYKRPKFYFGNFTKHKQPTDKELITWATEKFRAPLQECVEKVIYLDKNQTAYEEKRQQSLWTKDKEYYFEGGYEREQLRHIQKNIAESYINTL